MSESVQYVLVSWTTVEVAARKIAHLFNPGEILHVVGVARGGLVPAVIISHLLDAPVHSIEVVSYKGDKKIGSPRVYVEPVTGEILNQPTTLIVDDIYDSGETMDTLQRIAPFAMKACLITKRDPVNIPYNIITVDKCDPRWWIVFPWEQTR